MQALCFSLNVLFLNVAPDAPLHQVVDIDYKQVNRRTNEQKTEKNSENEQKWGKMSKNEQKWGKMRKNEQKWGKMSKNEQKTAKIYNLFNCPLFFTPFYNLVWCGDVVQVRKKGKNKQKLEIYGRKYVKFEWNHKKWLHHVCTRSKNKFGWVDDLKLFLNVLKSKLNRRYEFRK